MRLTKPISRDQLIALGKSPDFIQAAVNRGELIEFKRNWFTTKIDHIAVAAIRNGARIGCLTACAFYGVWVPLRQPQHWIYAKLPKDTRVKVTWHHERHLPKESVVSLERALEQVVRFHDAETALIVLENAVNRQKISENKAQEILHNGPARIRRVAHMFNPRAQSGSETRLRLFFQQRHVPVVAQAPINGIGRVDLLVGKSLIVEADSTAFHSSPNNVHADRERDMIATNLGYTCIRLSYEQIWDYWAETKAYLSQMLKTRKHRREPRPLVAK